MTIRLMRSAAPAAVVTALAAGSAQAADLTLCWAAWDPANALVELSKDFEEQSGHSMSFEFVPWPNFADRMLNELNSGGQLCDLMIGDSQWIGLGAEAGHYVKLNDFFEAQGISMEDFIPATVTGYAEWPKGTPELLGPAGLRRRGRLDLPPRLVRAPRDPRGLRGRVRARARRSPETMQELMDIARFFQGREIDGETRYGAAIYTERGSEGVTMGVTNALYNFGFLYDNPGRALRAGGVRQLARGGGGPGVLQANSTSAARRRARPIGTCPRTSTPTDPARSPCR